MSRDTDVKEPGDHISMDEENGPEVHGKTTLRKEAVLMMQPRPQLALLAVGCTLIGVIVGFSLGLMAGVGQHHHHPGVASATTTQVQATPGMLGVEIRSDVERPRDDSKVVAGARVTRVFAGTPATRVGLLPGDLIVAVDDIEVSSSPQLVRAIRQRRAGSMVTISYYRGGSYHMTVPTSLAQLSPEFLAASKRR